MLSCQNCGRMMRNPSVFDDESFFGFSQLSKCQQNWFLMNCYYISHMNGIVYNFMHCILKPHWIVFIHKQIKWLLLPCERINFSKIYQLGWSQNWFLMDSQLPLYIILVHVNCAAAAVVFICKRSQPNAAFL